MKVLFLRGKVDKRTQRVERLEDSHDMWTHLAAALSDDVRILYWGGEREHHYREGLVEQWVPKLKNLSIPRPDIIFCRGGFPEYQQVLDQYPWAIRIYYGAGARYMPDSADYSICLVDSQQQRRRVRAKYSRMRVYLWFKPAAPHFKPVDVPKEYDVGYIANAQQDKIKRLKWVYQTVPSHIRLLHLGYPPKYDPPSNVFQRRVKRGEMPEWISRCWMGIVPYSAYDSAPRAISEMWACDLPLVLTNDVNQCYNYGKIVHKSEFWSTVETALMMAKTCTRGRLVQVYNQLTGIDKAAHFIQDLIKGCWHE